MKKWYMAVAALAMAMTIEAQTVETFESSDKKEKPKTEKTKAKKVFETIKNNVKIYGFVRNYFYYNSRENVETSGGLIELIPKDEDNNALGEDMNDVASSRFLATTTRIGLDITGPKILGATSNGKIEVDFNGYGDQNSLLRIRHAYFRLNWLHHNLTFGQTWHPIVGCATPDEFSYEAGAPYNGLNRSPQIQYNYVPVEGLSLKAAILWQLQYTSPGPSGIDDAGLASMTNSVNFTKYSIIPEMYAGVSYKKNGWDAGIGVDILHIRPRVKGSVKYETEGGTIETTTRKVDDKLWSFSPMIYAEWVKNNWSIKAKSVLSQNCGHLNMISGYGVSGVDEDGSLDYTSMVTSNSYINIFYGKKLKGGIYAGYSKNLGTTKDLYNFGTEENAKYYTYYKGKNGGNGIDQHWRICPSITYNLKHLNFGVQYELTAADYGTMERDGKVSDTHTVYNHRVCGMVKYNF